MQQRDYVLIGATAIFSAVMSFIISGVLITPAGERTQEAEVVESISDQFVDAPDQYFNSNSVNPTQLIQISPGAPDSGVPFGQ